MRYLVLIFFVVILALGATYLFAFYLENYDEIEQGLQPRVLAYLEQQWPHSSLDAEEVQFEFFWPPHLELKNVRWHQKQDQAEFLIVANRAIIQLNLVDVLFGVVRVEPLEFYQAQAQMIRHPEPEEDESNSASEEKQVTKVQAPRSEVQLFRQKDWRNLDPRRWKFQMRGARFFQSDFIFKDQTQAPGFIFAFSDVGALFNRNETFSPWQLTGQGKIGETRHLFFDGSIDNQTSRAHLRVHTKEPSVILEGQVDYGDDDFQWNLGLQAKGIVLQDLFEALQMEAPVSALLTTRLQLQGEGTHPLALKGGGLALEGSVDLRDGEVAVVNLVQRLVLQVLQFVATKGPNLGQNRPSEAISALFTGERTSFDIAQARVQIRGKRLFFDRIRVQSKSFFLEADGSVQLENNEADIRAQLVVMEELSRKLVEENPELEKMQNQKGRIVIPFYYRGLVTNVSLAVDREYLEFKFQKWKNEEVKIDLDKEFRRSRVSDEELAAMEAELEEELYAIKN